MAEYYALLARAAGALQRNDEASRREIYVKARGALIKQLKAINPPLPTAKTSEQRLALEEAIQRVEREAVEAAAAAMMSQEEIARGAEQAVEVALVVPSGEPGSPSQVDYTGGAEQDETGEIDQGEANAEVVTPPGRSRSVQRAPREASWERAANVTDLEEPPPREGAGGPPPLPPKNSQRDGGGWGRAPRKSARPKRSSGLRLLILTIVVLIIGGVGYYGWTERDTISDFVSSFLGTDTDTNDEAEGEGGVAEVAVEEEVAVVQDVAVVGEPAPPADDEPPPQPVAEEPEPPAPEDLAAVAPEEPAAAELLPEPAPEPEPVPAPELGPESTPAAIAAVIEAHELAATYVSVLVDEDLLADPRDLEEIGRYHCEGRTGCRAMIWFSRSYMPLSLPVEARQTEAAVFGYGISSAGRELVQWNCNLFPEFEENGQCLPVTHRLL